MQPPERSGPPPKKGRYSPLVVFGIAAFGVLAFYLLLVVASQADRIFLPGNEIKTGILANLPGIDSGQNPEAADINQRINILVLGLDRRVGEPKDLATRTDTIFVLTVDPFSKTAGVFSIPRDLWVEIPDGQGGFLEQRINVSFEYGETVIDYPGGGPQLAIDTIEHNFGIPIDHYVVADFEGFIDVIDELGGVDIDVPRYYEDYSYADTVGEPAWAVTFQPGRQHMDGRTALAYVRIRKGSNDLDRIQRQQQVIRAAAERALGLELLLPNRALSLYNKYKDAVDTDISDFLVPGLARLAQQIGPERMRMVSLASAVSPYTSEDGASILIADWAKVEELKRQIFADGRLQAEAAVIKVHNGTDIPGLAAQFAQWLRGQGLPPEAVLVGKPSLAVNQTVILNLNSKNYTAGKLAEWLNLGSDRILAATDPQAAPFAGSGADIVVLLGGDASLPGG